MYDHFRGLITYRETGLAFDPNESSTRDQEYVLIFCMLQHNKLNLLFLRYVASVIAHELAHQWFGELMLKK